MHFVVALSHGGQAVAFIDGVGSPEVMLIVVIVFVLFGGKKLPEFARALGKTIREFKKATAGVEQEIKRALEEEPTKSPPAAPFLPAPPAHDPMPASETPTPSAPTPCQPSSNPPAPA